MSDDLPPDPEPTPPPPGSSMYFEVTPYQPDGGAPFLGVLLTLGLLVPGGVVAGWLLSELIPWVWAIPVVPEKLLFLILLLAFFGLGVAALMPGRWGLRWGRIRNPFVASAAGVFGVAVIAVTLARCEYHRVLGQPNIELEDGLSWLAYAVGAVSMGAIAIWGFRAVASAPFCSQCNTWKIARHSRNLDLAPDYLLRAVTTGDILPLADYDLSRNQGHLMLKVSVCPRCGEDAPVEVQVQHTTVNAKGEKKIVDLATTSYPGEALRVLDALFAGGEPRK
jgi:hypothetical protein